MWTVLFAEHAAEAIFGFVEAVAKIKILHVSEINFAIVILIGDVFELLEFIGWNLSFKIVEVIFGQFAVTVGVSFGFDVVK